MKRNVTIILSLLFLACTANGQVVIVGTRPAVQPFRPQGIILPPVLPVQAPGLVQRPGFVRPVQRVAFNPYWYAGGYLPIYPYYDVSPMTPTPVVVNNIFTPAPAPVAIPAPPPETKARLQLNIPRRSQVWLNDKQVDIDAVPVLLESPDLKAGQKYTFNVKIVWMEGDKKEERTRSVTVAIGEQTSLSYFTAN
jgi:uncharacterized protein (TIGR03000 family)